MNGLIARSRDSVVESPGHLFDKYSMNINTDAFSHGQIVSKLWLCDELDKFLLSNVNIIILGGWYNVLGFMLMTRRSDIGHIINIDIDPEAIQFAEKVSNAWSNVINMCSDANSAISMFKSDLVINCSPEHFENNDWFGSVRDGTLVCIQSSDMTDPNHPWLIKQPSPDIQTFLERFPVSEVLFTGTKRIQYASWGYNRFMLIGRK